MLLTDDDSELSWEHSSVGAVESETGADKGVTDLKGNRMLSTEAKNILSDLELDSEDESGKFFLYTVHCRVLLQVCKLSSQYSQWQFSKLQLCTCTSQNNLKDARLIELS